MARQAAPEVDTKAWWAQYGVYLTPILPPMSVQIELARKHEEAKARQAELEALGVCPECAHRSIIGLSAPCVEGLSHGQ
jgi:hypothetical protein